MKLGSHVSIEGGVSNAVVNASLQGSTAFAMWLKNARGWRSKPYNPDEVAKFKDNCNALGFDPATDILPHASYLINLGNPDSEKREKSRAALLDEMQRCEQLGIHLYNIHPGSALGASKSTAIENIASAINWAHKKTNFVKVVLENMAGDPSRIVGTELSDLTRIIRLVHNKQRIGVCIDTCHTLAAGWDLTQESGFRKFWDEFDEAIGMEFLSAIHVNDSCWPRGSHRDQHASIGTGFCGPNSFRLLMNRADLSDIIKIIETPTHAKDLSVLHSLIGKSKSQVDEMCEPLVDEGLLMRIENQQKTNEKRKKEATKQSRNRTPASLNQFKVVAVDAPRRKKR